MVAGEREVLKVISGFSSAVAEHLLGSAHGHFRYSSVLRI